MGKTGPNLHRRSPNLFVEHPSKSLVTARWGPKPQVYMDSSPNAPQYQHAKIDEANCTCR